MRVALKLLEALSDRGADAFVAIRERLAVAEPAYSLTDEDRAGVVDVLMHAGKDKSKLAEALREFAAALASDA